MAAVVNDREISIHQVNHLLGRTPNINPEQAEQVRRQALERLIDQEVVLQKAIDQKLDRDPRVMQAVESARREIIARAYVEQVMGQQAKPTSDEIKAFYDEHPELFRSRRVYTFQEIAVRTTDQEQLAKLQNQLRKAKTMAEVAAWLKGQDISYSANTVTKAAEQLPVGLLPKFHAMKDGQVGFVSGREGVSLVHLQASSAAAIDEKAAAPIIEQLLLARKRNEAAGKDVKQLRTLAQVAYVGEFAPKEQGQAAADAGADKAADAGTDKLSGGQPSSGPGEAGAPPSAEAVDGQSAPQVAAAPAAPSSAVDDSARERGVAGLK